MMDINDILPADFRPLTGERLTADSLETLEAIDRAALETNGPGRLTAVGLVLLPAAYDDGTKTGIREADLPALIPRLRTLSGITVRGCLVRPALGGADAGTIAACFHEIYQAGKRVSALLPCAMPWLGFDGMLAPIAACVEKDPAGADRIRVAAETVAMQNRTAFYARLLIS